MKTLFLMFTRGDEINWTEQKYLCLLEKQILQLKNIPQCNVSFFCTDSIGLKEAFRGIFDKIAIFKNETPNKKQSRWENVIKYWKIPRDEKIVIIDLHNLLLNANRVTDAIKNSNKKNQVLVSTRKVGGRVHEYARFHKIETSASIHLFDDQYKLSGQVKDLIIDYRITLPFRFYWEQFVHPMNPGIYQRHIHRDGVNYTPVINSIKKEPAIILEDRQSARLAVPSKISANMDGVSIPDMDNRFEISVTRHKQKIKVFREKSNGCYFKMVPFHQDRPNLELQYSGEFNGNSADIPIDIKGKKISGFTISIYLPILKGTPDNCSKFRPIKQLWAVDKTGKLKNMNNGKAITGRQQDIEILELTGDLMMGKAKDLYSLDHCIEKGWVHQFQLPVGHKKIHNHIDFLYYLATKRAQEEFVYERNIRG